MGASRALRLIGLFSLACLPARGSAQDAPAIAQAPGVARGSLLHSLDQDEIALTGFVRDEATGAPVPNIFIMIEGSDVGTATGEDGAYLIRHLDRERRIPRPTMVRVVGRAYFAEIREVTVMAPWEGMIVVIDGRTMPNPGYAVRLDFFVRRRPNVF